MPSFALIKRKELIHQLRKLGFSGTLVGVNHQYMVQGKLKIWIPNPHQRDISKSLLAKILHRKRVSQRNPFSVLSISCLD
ncbi:MAG: type II toxin-antitoxin system HicA family toxin [Microcystis viridis Mv_BB_P_19951000_S69]|jgi:hypothetical protein|uniref:Type II toxin-antitoxin system HicA family toxin n=2 Tax=Microcystis TaxID=1125 RepID=A0A552HXQ7_MICVR|nr:type II toxin-antitoxin system HicA family toxin [Microcystis aeruginosa LG13-11]QGZ91895.1 hypothetical protein GQR42_22625 [Microcystis aeruginosa FD4]TRU72078.1 MAG: type II toxin-antitoxin system HicA family toxin [Microcystis viridis Mv_BB_P_19951000_S68]TRU76002.1 MAG: type II toxin-antitoxin system HicA family toxin [Microcystis viridis Mv_BB_P_19951000_S68D]TRU79473.1 MAG: type II toxin-antitoxin system HicA family toxin [Microcystis viridis Mv_BB_P_19951000_S69]TRU89896.1 MAG: type